jgi:two-component system C4-dicarboxylate transport sensor histidine kinase DctB
LKNAEEAALRAESKPRIVVRSSYDPLSEQVRIDIVDNGPGITPEVQPHIFEPFFTTKPAGGGTGLGLTIAKRIVKEHAGIMSFTTGIDMGTVFRIEISRAPSP